MGNDYDHVFLPIGSAEVVTHNLAPRLGTGEALTGTPVVSDVTDSGSETGELTISGATLNAVADSVNGFDVNEAIKFKISTSETTSDSYLLKLSCSKDTGDGQTVVDYLWVHFDYPCQ